MVERASTPCHCQPSAVNAGSSGSGRTFFEGMHAPPSSLLSLAYHRVFNDPVNPKLAVPSFCHRLSVNKRSTLVEWFAYEHPIDICRSLLTRGNETLTCFVDK